MLNGYFVPVHISNDDYGAGDGGPNSRTGFEHAISPEERAERRRIVQEAMKAGLKTNTVNIYILDPQGQVVNTYATEKDPVMEMAMKEGRPRGNAASLLTGPMVKMLEKTVQKLKTKQGKPVVNPVPLSACCQAKAEEELVLHLVARYLPLERFQGRVLPGENMIRLQRTEWSKLLGPAQVRVGTSWELDKEITAKVLTFFYPQTWNNNETANSPEIHKIEKHSLKATVVSVADGTVRVRLDGSLKMKHSSSNFQADDATVDATLVGFMDIEAGKKIRTLRLVTEKATYPLQGRSVAFGVAVRSIPWKK